MKQIDNLFFEQNSNFIDSELETMDPTLGEDDDKDS